MEGNGSVCKKRRAINDSKIQRQYFKADVCAVYVHNIILALAVDFWITLSGEKGYKGGFSGPDPPSWN